MARTVDAIYARLFDGSPTWLRNWSIGQTLLRGLATLLRTGETTWELFEQVLRTDTALTADEGDWIDAHGEDAGVERWPGEPDAAYQLRAWLDPRGPTPERMKRRAVEELRHLALDGYVIGYGEPTHTVCDVDLFADDPTAVLFAEGEAPFNAQVLVLPEAEIVPSPGFFADLDFADLGAFAHATPDDENLSVYQRLADVATNNKPAGTRVFLFIEDTGQLPYLVHLDLYF